MYFAKLKILSRLVSSKNLLMALQISSVDHHVKLAVLLCNAHTCLYDSNVSSYFEVRPPTLQQQLKEEWIEN